MQSGSDFLALHRAGDVVRLPDRQRDDRQRRIAGRAAGELAAVGDEQVLDVVGLAELVHHAVPRLLAHPVGAEVVRAGIGRRRIGHGGADGLVDRGALLVGVVAHRDVVGMIVEMHARHRHAELVLGLRIERDAVGLLRHVLADQPHAGHARIGLHRA